VCACCVLTPSDHRCGAASVRAPEYTGAVGRRDGPGRGTASAEFRKVPCAAFGGRKASMAGGWGCMPHRSPRQTPRIGLWRVVSRAGTPRQTPAHATCCPESVAALARCRRYGWQHAHALTADGWPPLTVKYGVGPPRTSPSGRRAPRRFAETPRTRPAPVPVRRGLHLARGSGLRHRLDGRVDPVPAASAMSTATSTVTRRHRGGSDAHAGRSRHGNSSGKRPPAQEWRDV
jgi:hypothetical protein